MRTFFSIFQLLVCINIAAQTTVTPPVLLTHISDENGLCDNHVTCVYKDKTELLWVGTKDGLNLIDGSTTRVYRNNPADSNTICDNFISGITEDNLGKIWIATANGFCSYNKASRQFTNIRYYGTDKASVGWLSNIAADKEGHLWLGGGSGLLQYDLKTKNITRYFNGSTSFNTDTRYSNRINKVIVSSSNGIWLATADGLWNYSPAGNSFTKIIHKQNDAFYQPLCMTVYEDHEKNIWAGFWNTGLRKYEPATGKLTDYGVKMDHGYTISAISEMIQPDGNKILWLNGRLLAYDEKKEDYFSYPAPVTEKEFPNVNPIYQSDDGWLWLAGDDGLYIYNPRQQVFNHQLYSNGITSQGIVFANYKNKLLVGAQGADFLKWKDDKGNTIKDYSNLRRKESAMLCMLQDGPDDFWMGTSDGILHTDLSTGYQKWFYHIDSDSSSLPRDFIASLFIDSKKNCWVFPWREGIWQMDMQTGKCRKKFDGFINESGKIKKLVISDAAEDAEGNIWMTDLDEGIILYDVKTNTFSKPFEKQIGSKTHTDKIFIHENRMYSALSNAILKWDIHERKLQFIPLPAELNKPISDFFPDKTGNWWLATASGLIVFNEQAHSFRKFTTADGLYQNDVNGTLFCTASGEMTIGNPNYISFFDPQQLDFSSSGKKNVLVTEFVAGGRHIDPGSSVAISLHNNENNIIIRWALPAYSNPFKNRYYYQLQGIDSAWRYAGNTGEVQYANLSSGHYTVFLKATTANETESGNIIKLSFKINPPFWKTWWFISLAILAISSLFFAVVRYISQRNLKEKLLRLEKEQAIEKERNRISRDMHDDLGSGLTKIAIMSEVVKKQIHEPEKAKQLLENISGSSRELVDSLQDIIWVLNPKNDTLESLAAYTREYGLKFFEPFGINIQFNYPEKFSGLKLSEEVRRNIFLVIKETFNNTGKHAWCNKVLVTIEQAISSLLLKIEDDGKGFDMEKLRQFGNGLINMKNRIEQIGGTYQIESGTGKGSKTTIEIPV